MAVKFANLASSTLASSLSNTATSISVTSSSSFPTLGSGDYFYASIGEGSGSEIVKVTGVSSNTFTVVRGQDGTSAQNWSSGSPIALRVVAAALDDIAEQAQTAADTESVSIDGDTMTGTLNFSSAANPLISSQYGEVLWHDDQFSQDLIKQVYATTIGDYLQLIAGGSGSNVIHKFGQGYADLGGYLKIDGVTRIDNSGNATLGTISSGSITTTGTLALTDDTAIAWGSGSSRPAIIGNTADDDLDIYISGNSIVNVDASGIDVAGAITSSGQITARSDFVAADSGGTARGYLFGTSGGLFLRYNSGTSLQIQEAGSTRVTIGSGGNATFTGTVTTPYVRVTGTGDASLSSTTHGIQVGATSGQNLLLDNNEVLSRNNGAASFLHLQADGGTVTVGAGTTANLTVSGTLTSGVITATGNIKSSGVAHPEFELIPTGSVGNADIRFDGTSLDIRSNSSSAYLTLQTATTERLKITNTGNFEFNGGNFSEVGTISSSGRHTITGGATGDILLKMGSSTQTQYVDLQMASNSGVGELFKNGTAFTSYGGASSFNVYNSNGLIAFHPSNTANVLQIDTTGLNVGASRTIRMNGSTVIDASRNITAGAISATSVGVTNIVTNKIVKFNGTILDDSNLTDDGSNLTIAIPTVINSGSDGILSLNQATTGWNYIQYQANGTRKFYVGNDATDGFVVGSDNSGKLFKFQNFGNISADTADISLAVGKKLYFGGGSHTYISEDIDDRLRFFVGGAEFMRFSEDTNDSAGIYVPTTFSSNVTVNGSLSVLGTTTTIDTANLNVEDNNITLNYSTGDSSATANGAGITIQDAVNSTTDATILWNATHDRFDISHSIVSSGNLEATGYLQHFSFLYSRDDLRVLNAAGTGWHTWADRVNGTFNLNVGTITSGALSATGNSTISGSGSSSYALNVYRGSDGSSAFRVFNTGEVLVSSNYFYVDASQGAYFNGLLRARGGISNDGGNNLSISSGGSDITFNSKNFTSVGNISSNGITVASGHNVHLTNGNVTIGDYGNTNTGTLFLRGSTANRQAVLKATNGNLHIDSNAGNSTYINYYTGGGTYFGSGAGGVVAVMGPDGDLWKGSADNAGSKYWHAGNDGSGSGLDADTVDGVHASGFVRRDGQDAGSVTIRVNDADFIVQDTSDSTTNYIWRHHTNQYLYLGTANAQPRTRYDLYTDVGSNKYWHAGNDGAGSGLDADTVDGYDVATNGPNKILRSNGNGYLMIGTWIDIGSTGLYSATLGNHFHVDAQGYILRSGHATDSRIRLQTSNATTRGFVYSNSSNQIGFLNPSSYWRLQVPSSGDIFWHNGSGGTGGKLWHALNDGSGSGLDADFLDGLQGSSYLRSDADDAYDGVLTMNGMQFRPSNVNRNLRIQGTSGGSDVGISGFTSNGTHGFQIYGTTSGTYGFLDGDWANWDLQVTKNGGLTKRVSGATATIWHSSNDGSGSGLDADTLDAFHASQFLRSDTSTALTGELNVTRNGGVTGTSAPQYSDVNIELQTSNNNVPGISFHRGGYSATTLYERDGELYVNAWTTRAQTGKLVSFGNDGSGSGLDADTLDGVQGASFLRSDADDSMTGNITFSQPKGLIFANGQQIKDNGGGGLVLSSSYQINLNQSTGLTTNGNTIWHSGNDGSGSGLDADTVDGYHFTNHEGVGYYEAFLVYGDTDKYYPVVINGGAGHSTDVKIWRGYNEYGPDDWNTSTHKGGLTFRYRLSGSAGWGGFPNRIKVLEAEEIYTTLLGGINYTAHTQRHVVWLRGGGTNGARYHISSTSGLSLAIYTDTSSGYTSGSGWLVYNHSNNLYDVYEDYRTLTQRNAAMEGEVYNTMSVEYGGGQVRHVLGGTGPSKTFWHTSNDGSGSGLDADLLDGLQLHTGRNNVANRVVRTDVNGYIQAGWINTTSGDDGTTVPGRVYCSTDDYIRYLDLASFRSVMNVTAKASYQGREQNTSDQNYWVGSMGWGATNMNTMFNYGSGFIDAWSNPANAPGSGHWTGFQSLHYTSSNTYHHGMQMVMGSGNPSNTYLRGWWANGGSGYAWQKIWTTGNDGAGSGLDADLLDGLDSSIFFKSYTNNNGGWSASNRNFSVRSGGNAVGLHMEESDGTFGFQLYGDGGTYGFLDAEWGAWDIKKIRNGSFHVDEGSGLKRVLNEANWSSYISVPTNNNQLTNGAGYITSSGTANQSHMVSGSAFGTTSSPGSVLEYQQATSQTDTKLAPSTDWHNSIRMGHGNPYTYYSSTIAVRMTGTGTGDLFTQNIGNGSANGWRRHWSDANDGSGSGLDADTVDGKNSTDFTYYRGIVSGNWDTMFTTGTGKTGTSGLYEVHNISNTDTNYPSGAYTYGGVLAWNLSASTFKLYAPHIGNLYYQTGWNNDEYSGWRKVWDTGNDGAGSGLDADLLDGQHGSYYYSSANHPPQTNFENSHNNLVSNTGNGANLNLTFTGSAKSGHFDCWGSGANLPPSTSHVQGIQTRHSTTTHYGWQIAGQYNQAAIWKRYVSNGSFSSWHQIWTSGTDGSGSGLDADVLRSYAPAQSGGNTIHLLASNGYSQINNWIFVGTKGIYSSTNSAHFYPNGSHTYGTWRINGSRNSYSGIWLDYSNVVIGMYDSGGNGGDYSSSATGGWHYYYHRNNRCMGIGGSTTSSSYGLYEQAGGIYSTGNVTAYSDRRIKENIATIDNALEKVNKLEGVYYTRIDDPDKNREIGFIAQDVNEVTPELVTYAEDVDQYGVKYQNATALLVEAVKTLTQQVKDLQAEIEELKNA